MSLWNATSFLPFLFLQWVKKDEERQKKRMRKKDRTAEGQHMWKGKKNNDSQNSSKYGSLQSNPACCPRLLCVINNLHCCNKFSQRQWLKITPIYYCIVLEIRDVQCVSRAVPLLWTPVENPSPSCFQTVEAAFPPWLLVPPPQPSLQPLCCHHSSISASPVSPFHL